MTSAAPARKPYRKAPPQHRETRHALPVAPPTPAAQHELNQVKHHSSDTPPAPMLHCCPGARPPHAPLPRSDTEPEASSVSSLEIWVPPSGRFSSQRTYPARTRTRTPQSPAALRKASASRRLPEDRRHQWSHTAAPRSILKQPGCLGLEHTYDIIRKSRSAELLGDGRREDSQVSPPPVGSECCRTSPRPGPSIPRGTRSKQKMQVLKEKVRFSNFLDEITCRVLSPAHLRQLGKPLSVRAQGHPSILRCSEHRESEETSAERSRRWDSWVSAVQRPSVLHLQEEAGHRGGDSTDRLPRKREKGVKRDVQRRHKHSVPPSYESELSHMKVGVHGRPAGLEGPPVFPGEPPDWEHARNGASRSSLIGSSVAASHSFGSLM